MPFSALLSFFQQAHRMAGHALTFTGKAQILLRGCFYIHPARIHSQGMGNVLLHGADKGTQLGLLGNHGHIDVAHPIARLRNFFSHCLQKLPGVRPLVAHIRIREMQADVPQTRSTLEREVTFITSQELEDLYPDLTPSERENVITREHHTVFLMQIGKTLRSGKPHDGRAPDYDDWELNGDILFYNPLLDRAFEISSMGIRVSPESLERQLALSGCTQRRSLPYHRSLLAGELPYSIGGGIGQSRLCMLLLGCAHIGEVQCSVWDAETRRLCEAAGINLL